MQPHPSFLCIWAGRNLCFHEKEDRGRSKADGPDKMPLPCVVCRISDRDVCGEGRCLVERSIFFTSLRRRTGLIRDMAGNLLLSIVYWDLRVCRDAVFCLEAFRRMRFVRSLSQFSAERIGLRGTGSSRRRLCCSRPGAQARYSFGVRPTTFLNRRVKCCGYWKPSS